MKIVQYSIALVICLSAGLLSAGPASAEPSAALAELIRQQGREAAQNIRREIRFELLRQANTYFQREPTETPQVLVADRHSPLMRDRARGTF